MDRVRIFDLRVDNLDMEEALALVKGALKEEGLYRVYTPNTEIAMETRDKPYLADLVNSGDLVLADGIGLVMGSRLRKCPLKDRVTGFDVSMALLDEAQEEGYGVYLLGGRPGVAQEAKDRLNKTRPQLNIAGCHHGYFETSLPGDFPSQEEEEVLEDIRSSGAQILFVGLGFPKQETWLRDNQDRLGPVRLGIGNGGVIDILAGRAKRAPQIFIKLHLEWLYRMLKEPSRIKRQVAIPKFIWTILRDKEAIGYIDNDTGGNND